MSIKNNINKENKSISSNLNINEEELSSHNDGINDLLIEQIFYQKYSSKNYEIYLDIFKEIKVSHMEIVCIFIFFCVCIGMKIVVQN